MVFNLKKILFLGLLLVIAGTVSAQTPQPSPAVAESDDSSFIDVRITPENPAALSPVSLFLASNLINLSTADISWEVDGKKVLSGTGARTLETVTKSYGQTSHIIATITSPSGTVAKVIDLTPQDITLLWEATDSYVPPFYQGKKLPGRESLVRMTAIPNFPGQTTLADQKNNSFVWKRNGTVVPTASGYGNNSFLIKQSSVRLKESVGVSVQSAGETSAEKSTVLSFVDPVILLYNEQTNGQHQFLGGSLAQLTRESMTVRAEPYFFSTTKNNPSQLSPSWTMNNQPVSLPNASDKFSITVKNPQTSGVATIGLSVENPLTPFQSATTKFSLLFKKP